MHWPTPMRKRKGPNGFVYRSYNFVDKDPVIDELRTVIQREGFMKKGGLSKLSTLSGVSYSCYENWFFGETKRPQNASIEATARAMGYRRNGFEKFKEINFEAAIKRIKSEQE